MSEKRYDGAEVLSRLSGLSKPDIMSIWDEVKANKEKLKACPQHRFDALEVKIGQKIVCLECGGTMGLTQAADYVTGYRDAGGDPEKVWPGFFSEKPKAT